MNSSFGYIPVSATTQLSHISSNILTLSAQLSNDTDIKDKLKKLVAKSKRCVQLFDIMVRNEWQDVRVQKDLLMSTNHPQNVNLKGMTNSLTELKVKLTSIKNEVLSTQGQVHSDIETCRERICKKKNSVMELKANIEQLKEEMRDIEEMIQTLDSQARELSTAAQILLAKAEEGERNAKQKKTEGIKDIFKAGAGVLFAPLTLGISIGYTVIKSAEAADNFKEASDCRKESAAARNNASCKQQEASRLMYAKGRKKDEVQQYSKEIAETEKSIDILKADETKLIRITDQLYALIKAIDMVLHALQNAETTICDTSVHSQGFFVVQNMFRRLMGKDGNFKHIYQGHHRLEELQSKWTTMEDVLMNSWDSGNPKMLL